jgi:hypothetical protein
MGTQICATCMTYPKLPLPRMMTGSSYCRCDESMTHRASLEEVRYDEYANVTKTARPHALDSEA